MKSNVSKAVLCAFLAAVFYAINVPFSKLLLVHVAPVYMASFLYFGAGVGIAILYLFHWKEETKSDRLSRKDLPYTMGMIVLDIVAPILLMMGVEIGSSANATLLGNFEIVATALIAFLVFREKVSRKLFVAILFITASSIVLSFEGSDSFHFSLGSILVLLATCCWGLENNCTRKISDKSSYEIVTIKGLCCGLGSFMIAQVIHEPFPEWRSILLTMLLGFVAYGLSIFLYVRAQRNLGAARTSAYYAAAPFIGTFLALIINGESLSVSYFFGLLLMVIGTALVISDTLVTSHQHEHEHILYDANGNVLKTIHHTHRHTHVGNLDSHHHHHLKTSHV